MPHLLETDARRRISLAKLGAERDTYYLAERRDDGSILLVPAEVRPKVLEVIERVVPNLRTEVATVTEVREREEWTAIRDQHAAPTD